MTLEEGELVHFDFAYQGYGYGRVRWVSGNTVSLRAVDARCLSVHANVFGDMIPRFEPLCVPLSSVTKWQVGR